MGEQLGGESREYRIGGEVLGGSSYQLDTAAQKVEQIISLISYHARSGNHDKANEIMTTNMELLCSIPEIKTRVEAIRKLMEG